MENVTTNRIFFLKVSSLSDVMLYAKIAKEDEERLKRAITKNCKQIQTMGIHYHSICQLLYENTGYMFHIFIPNMFIAMDFCFEEEEEQSSGTILPISQNVFCVMLMNFSKSMKIRICTMVPFAECSQLESKIIHLQMASRKFATIEELILFLNEKTGYTFQVLVPTMSLA